MEHHSTSLGIGDVRQRHGQREDPHQRTVGCGVLGIAVGDIAPIGEPQRCTGCVAHIGGIARPATPGSPQRIGIVTAGLDERECHGHCHLRVVGELTWCPVEAAATHHLADATQHWRWEPLAVLPGRPELERGAECIANGRAHHDAHATLPLQAGEPRRGAHQ